MISLIHLEELSCALSCGVRQGLEITVCPLFSLSVAIQEWLQTCMLLCSHETKYSLLVLFSLFFFYLCFCQLPSGLIFACKLFSYRRNEKKPKKLLGFVCRDLSITNTTKVAALRGWFRSVTAWHLTGYWPTFWMPSAVLKSCLISDWFRHPKFYPWPSMS